MCCRSAFNWPGFCCCRVRRVSLTIGKASEVSDFLLLVHAVLPPDWTLRESHPLANRAGCTRLSATAAPSTSRSYTPSTCSNSVSSLDGADNVLGCRLQIGQVSNGKVFDRERSSDPKQVDGAVDPSSIQKGNGNGRKSTRRSPARRESLPQRPGHGWHILCDASRSGSRSGGLARARGDHRDCRTGVSASHPVPSASGQNAR